MKWFSGIEEEADITTLLFRDPATYRHLNHFADAILRGPSEFTIGERELMAAYVSALNSCHYCTGAHAAVAQQFGIAPLLLQALTDDASTAPIDEALKPVFAFIKTLTNSPSRIGATEAQAVYAAGWSEEALHDAVNFCALMSCYNRLLDGHGIRGSQIAFDNGARRLFKRGYKIPSPVVWLLSLRNSFRRARRGK